MIQATHSQRRARLPLVAVAAFALGALTAITASPLLGRGATTSQLTPSTNVIHASSFVIPAIAPSTTESGACGRGAYVTGDMVGDASPAAVYATLCGNH